MLAEIELQYIILSNYDDQNIKQNILKETLNALADPNTETTFMWISFLGQYLQKISIIVL